MQVLQHTVKRSPSQPGYIWTGGDCPSVQQRLSRVAVGHDMRCASITNEQFKSYESDLGMT